MDDLKEEDAEDTTGRKVGGDDKVPTPHAWYLVDADKKKLRLPTTMLFLGREECDILIQSGTVDKRHAVITFDLYLSRFKVKDLSTTNGTYVNESRIPEQEYVTLNHMDSIRLGYDSKVYHMEQGEPCGDSPPPLPRLVQPPANLEADNRHAVVSEETAWNGHPVDRMAECQLRYCGYYPGTNVMWYPTLGCIAEQRIEHTCTHAHSRHKLDHPFVDVQRRTDNFGAVLSEAELDPDPEVELESKDKPHICRNTWPRKKVRQVAHMASIFDADDSSDSGQILVQSGSNYFVSVDDSVCDRGQLTAEYSLSRAGSVQRILRNSRQPLPPELETVNKGTPLYGQPAWWGEDSDSNGEAAMEGQGNEHRSRPSSLVVQADQLHHHLHHHKDPRAVYMEIPHQATTPERDKPPPSGRDKTTPARSMTSSISKDSLVLSPDLSRGRSVDKDGGDAGKMAGESNPALSFTVDFGDEKKPKLKTGASLSEFVPPKIRNSLSAHARSEKSSSSSKGGSCKNSEERELSPERLKRFDDVWGPELVAKGKAVRRSSGQGTGVASLKTADFTSESTNVAAEKVKDTRKDIEKRLRDAEKELDSKPPRSPRSQEARKSSAANRISKSKPQTSAAAFVHAAQYSDTTAYLIDRMFAGSSGGPGVECPRSDSSEREGSDSPAAPEHAMYKEARDYDRASQRGSLTYRTPGKPAALKQKSLSKSPPSNGQAPAVTSHTTKSPVGFSPKSSSSKAAVKTPEKPAVRSPGKGGEQGEAVRAVPVVAPPAASADQEDKVSEAGTYTIEADEDGGEEEMLARQQIDEIFGVDVDNISIERPVIGSLEQLPAPEDDGQDEGEDDEGERTLHEDDEAMPPGCRTPCDEEDEEDEEAMLQDEERSMSLKYTEEAVVPSWLSQLNALKAASQQSPAAVKNAETGKVENIDTGDAENGRTVPQRRPSQKKPGTGRRLPSIPTANGQSPVDSDSSAKFPDNCPDSPAGSLNCSVSARLESSQNPRNGDSASCKAKFSPTIPSNGVTSGKVRLCDSPCDSENLNKLTSNGSTHRSTSAHSRGSIDTELLLRDTQTVMAAMEARMGFCNDGKEDDGGSDTDLSSTVALVNGDEDFVKPTKYHSPRDAMARKSNKDKDNSNIRLASASSSSSSSTKKSLVRSFSEHKPPIGDRTARSGASISVVSDVLSRNNSLDQSFQSDASDGYSDRTDSSFSRSGSRGKGTITMTKPNRAFALRRARADGSEATDITRSRATVTPPASSRRSSSIHGTTRTSHSDRTGTVRSEGSLGAQIVKKARESNGTIKPRESSATRGDSVRRNSMRGTDRRTSTPSTTSSATPTISSAKKERDLRAIRSQLKTTPAHKDLAITGIGSRSHSQPGSRSNSPKAAGRVAWERRRGYDPRKAVAEARASKPKEPRPKPKVQPSNLFKHRMSRSASFTNSVELSGRVRHDTYSIDSTSSAEDLSSAATAIESYSLASFQGAFIPFHKPLRSDRLTHSADEDEAGTFPTSKTLSPDSPPLQIPRPFRRRTLGAVEYDEVGASTAISLHRTQADSHRTQSSSPQSYDPLIVSSIYQLSLKLKTTMDKTLNKLRDQDRVSISPSPIDDFLGHPAKSEIPAWKSANQELAGVLKNLRKMEHHLQMMDKALFPDEDTDTDVSGMSSTEKHKYFQEIERIRNELAGFQPIHNPQTEPQDPGSPEMAELSRDIC